MAQQGPPPPRSGRLPAPRSNPRWGDADYPDENEELPPWAGLSVDPRWADGRERSKRPAGTRQDAGPQAAQGIPEEPAAPAVRPRGRQAAARARRTRRSVYLWGSVLIAAAVIGGGIWLLTSGTSQSAGVPDAIVTNFLPGEFKTVPNACTAVSASTLDAYLPGKRTVASPNSLDGGSASLCSWTLDARPVYRLLNVQAQAYAPNGLASGDGSATFAAIDGYDQALQQKAAPPKATHLPKATITLVPGLGIKAFSGLQVTRSAGVTTDLLTVVVRDRNVVVTAVLEGDSGRGGYGPVSAAQLRAGAVAAARDVLSQLK
ncbi:MAG TPA: hypothetical protein VMV92_12795 [Streptosporangiaceae bacterium]|nr:hypothetical protein [Streptosporangiaceae bacterium]